MIEVEARAAGRELLVRNTRLRGEEIKLVITGLVGGRPGTTTSSAGARRRASTAKSRFPPARNRRSYPWTHAEHRTRRWSCCRSRDGIFLTVGMIIGALIFKAPCDGRRRDQRPESVPARLVPRRRGRRCAARWSTPSSLRAIRETGGEYVFLSRRAGRGRGVRLRLVAHDGDPDRRHCRGGVRVRRLRLRDLAAGRAELRDLGGDRGGGADRCSTCSARCRSKALQKVMETVLITGLVVFAVAAHRHRRRARRASRRPAAAGSFGFAMIFVLLAYGGWNEAAYLAGEVRDARRNMTRILVGGVLAVTALYLLVNLGYLAVLGHAGVRDSKAVAADVMRVARRRAAARCCSRSSSASRCSPRSTPRSSPARAPIRRSGRDFRMLRVPRRLARERHDARQRAPAAGRDHAAAGGRGRGDAGWLQRDGRVHRAGVLDLLLSHRH